MKIDIDLIDDVMLEYVEDYNLHDKIERISHLKNRGIYYRRYYNILKCSYEMKFIFNNSDLDIINLIISKVKNRLEYYNYYLVDVLDASFRDTCVISLKIKTHKSEKE